MMIDMSYAQAMANGTDVWCDFAEQQARTRDGFCMFCGATNHKPIDDEPEPAADTAVGGQCQWFALCANTATTHIPHPILGPVAACERCVALAAKHRA